METSLIMCISKILTDSGVIKPKKNKKIFLQMLFTMF